MRKSTIIILVFFIIFILPVFGSDGVFNYPKSAKNIRSQVPKLPAVSCKFSQTKSINKSTILSSGGSFKISTKDEIIFETLYPIKTVQKYSSSQNRQIAKIISSLKNNNYTYLEKNFKLYFSKTDNNWILGLKSKEKSPVYKYLKNIVIYGNNKNILQITIHPINDGYTDIKFKECKPL